MATQLKPDLFQCKFCGATASLKGDPFTRPQSLAIHEKYCEKNPHQAAGTPRRGIKHPRKNGRHSNGKRVVLHGRRIQTRSPQQQEHATPSSDVAGAQAFALGIAFGHCQTWIDIYSNSVGIPQRVFAKRVGTLLRGSAGGGESTWRSQCNARYVRKCRRSG